MLIENFFFFLEILIREVVFFKVVEYVSSKFNLISKIMKFGVQISIMIK